MYLKVSVDHFIEDIQDVIKRRGRKEGSSYQKSCLGSKVLSPHKLSCRKRERKEGRKQREQKRKRRKRRKRCRRDVEKGKMNNQMKTIKSTSYKTRQQEQKRNWAT